MAISDSKPGSWGLLNMIKDKRIAGRVGSDKIGKVFQAISTQVVPLRRCLVCEGVFTREEAREHYTAWCEPLQNPCQRTGNATLY